MKKHLPVSVVIAFVALLWASGPMLSPVVAQLRTMAFNAVTISDTGANALIVGGAPGATSGTGGIKAGAISGSSVTSSGNVSDSVGTLDAVRDGGWTLPSQGVGDVFYALNGSSAGRVNGTGILKMNGASAPTVVSSATVGAVSLLCQVEGTDATAAATNVATCAISGLTVKDHLRVVVRHSSITQQTDTPVLYNSTDSVNVFTNLTAGTLVLNTAASASVDIMADPSATTRVVAQGMISNGTVITGGDTTGTVRTTLAAFTTAWTGSWTLALRTGTTGVNAGGTYYYRIAVYKVAGQ